jgi:hypothetical protein
MEEVLGRRDRVKPRPAESRLFRFVHRLYDYPSREQSSHFSIGDNNMPEARDYSPEDAEPSMGGALVATMQSSGTGDIKVLAEKERIPYADTKEFVARFRSVALFLVKGRETRQGSDIVVATSTEDERPELMAQFLEDFPSEKDNLSKYSFRHGPAVFESDHVAKVKGKAKHKFENGR